MFGCAIAWGHHPETAWNPYNGVVRYRHAPPGRLLGAGDPAKLGAIMRRPESECPVQLAAVPLILLTGCRPREIRRLRWSATKADPLAEPSPDRVTVAAHRKLKTPAKHAYSLKDQT